MAGQLPDLFPYGGRARVGVHNIKVVLFIVGGVGREFREGRCVQKASYNINVVGLAFALAADLFEGCSAVAARIFLTPHVGV